MSWHGPSAPRVEGIATKSRVVLSCASNPASTASRILRVVSAVFMMSYFPVIHEVATAALVRSNHTFVLTCSAWGRFQNHSRLNTMRLPPIERMTPGYAADDQGLTRRVSVDPAGWRAGLVCAGPRRHRATGRTRAGHRQFAAGSAHQGRRRNLPRRPDQGSLRIQNDRERCRTHEEVRPAGSGQNQKMNP